MPEVVTQPSAPGSKLYVFEAVKTKSPSTPDLVTWIGSARGAISFAVKSVMRRPRPFGEEFTVHKANIGGTSFPSGHVINYIGVYGTLAVILSHRLKSTFLRRIVVGFVGLKIALVGPSRIYLGHHWFTDVLTSYLLGSSYVVLLSSVYKRVARRSS